MRPRTVSADRALEPGDVVDAGAAARERSGSSRAQHVASGRIMAMGNRWMEARKIY